MEYEDLDRWQRAKLLLEDPQAYLDLIPDDQGYWLQLLDAIAKSNPIRE